MYTQCNNILLLYGLLLNNMIYHTQGRNILRGQRPGGIFSIEGVINLVLDRRPYNKSFII